MHKKNIWVCILISILILVAAQTVSLLIASAACAAGSGGKYPGSPALCSPCFVGNPRAWEEGT